MEQPITLHWQTSERFHTAFLTPDLFGGWVLVTSSGALTGRGGRIHQKPLATYDQGLTAIQQMRQRRRREGYVLSQAGFTEILPLPPQGFELRSAETEALHRLFEIWALTANEQQTLLGIDHGEHEHFLDGVPFAAESLPLLRAGHLLAIHKVLRLRLGGETRLIRAWLRRPSASLDGQTPVERMSLSLEALADLRHHLGYESDMNRSAQCSRSASTAST